MEDAWSDTSKAATPNKHTDFLKATAIMTLEWKEADEKFNTNILGWSVNNVKDDD